MRIASGGLRFVLPAVALTALSAWRGLWPPAVLFGLLSAAFLFFFRDPRRVPPPGEGLWTAPADGKVLIVEPVAASPVLGTPATRVAIFLSLLDVHVTRSPLAAAVESAEYRPGKFLRADKPEAGELNESRTLLLRGAGVPLVLRMIVGVAARRIKCYVRPGDPVARGQRIGLMYFGSRVELFLPGGVRPAVAPGDRVRAGRTVVAEVKA